MALHQLSGISHEAAFPNRSHRRDRLQAGELRSIQANQTTHGGGRFAQFSFRNAGNYCWRNEGNWANQANSRHLLESSFELCHQAWFSLSLVLGRPEFARVRCLASIFLPYLLFPPGTNATIFFAGMVFLSFSTIQLKISR